jgi:hypothetical protein
MVLESLYAAAAIVTVGSGVYGFRRWLKAQAVEETDVEMGDIKSWFQKRRRPLDVEMLPQYFEVTLTSTVPEVRVYVYVVNHLKRKISVEALSAQQFRLSSGHPVGTLTIGSEIEIEPHRTKVLMCQRTLVEAEIRAILSLPISSMPNACMTLAGRVRAGRKLLKVGPDSGVSVNGYITRPEPNVRAVPGSERGATKMDRFVES